MVLHSEVRFIAFSANFRIAHEWFEATNTLAYSTTVLINVINTVVVLLQYSTTVLITVNNTVVL